MLPDVPEVNPTRALILDELDSLIARVDAVIKTRLDIIEKNQAYVAVAAALNAEMRAYRQELTAG